MTPSAAIASSPEDMRRALRAAALCGHMRREARSGLICHVRSVSHSAPERAARRARVRIGRGHAPTLRICPLARKGWGPPRSWGITSPSPESMAFGAWGHILRQIKVNLEKERLVGENRIIAMWYDDLDRTQSTLDDMD